MRQKKATLQWMPPRDSLLAFARVAKNTQGRSRTHSSFVGYSGGIQGVFGGILMISKVFGDFGTFSDVAITTLGVTSDPPK